MRLYGSEHSKWYEPSFYPILQNLIDGFVSDDKVAVFLIDIAGNIGHDITELDEKFPDLKKKGRLILQDLPAVIESVKGKLPEGSRL
jgi:hypothetical protein